MGKHVGGKRERLAFSQRLHDPKEFDRVYALKKSLHGSKLVVFTAPNGLAFARLGVSVGSKHGNAVRRNRIKRVFRAAFRQAQHQLAAGYDYILIPRRGVTTYTTEEMRAALLQLTAKLKY